MPTKLTNEILAAAITGFEQQKKRLDVEIAELRKMLSPASTNGVVPELPRPRRKMSASARRRIAAAQKRRWAEARHEAGTTTKPSAAPAKKKRELSAAGRKAIIEATKKRWAAVRAAGKKSARS